MIPQTATAVALTTAATNANQPLLIDANLCNSGLCSNLQNPDVTALTVDESSLEIDSTNSTPFITCTGLEDSVRNSEIQNRIDSHKHTIPTNTKRKRYPKLTAARAKELLQWIPQRPDYHEWATVISVIGNSFDEQSALQILLTRFKDETVGETAQKLKQRMTFPNAGTLYNIARKYGYSTGTIKPNKSVATFSQNNKVTFSPASSTESTSASYQQVWRFTDPALEVMRQQMLHVPSASYESATREIMEHYNSPERERLFKISRNFGLYNKSKDYLALKNGFETCYLSASELATHVAAGFAFAPSCFRADVHGKVIRQNSMWESSEVLVADIDHGLRLEEFMQTELADKMMFAYTTLNHSPEQHRYRVLVALPYTMYNQYEYRYETKKLIDLLSADQSCIDPARMYYGNSGCQIIMPKGARV